MNELPNFTATEVLALEAAHIERLAKAREALIAPAIDAILDALVVWDLSLTVCARRARKLRKRGCKFLFAGRTSTGKSRYIKVLDAISWK